MIAALRLRHVGVGAADAGGRAGAASARATAATDAADAAADAAAADAARCLWLLPHAVGVLATGAAGGTAAELRPTHADSRRTGTRPSCTLPPLRSLARCLRNGTAAQRRTTSATTHRDTHTRPGSKLPACPPRRSAPHPRPQLGAERACDAPAVKSTSHFCPLENHLMLST
eukprot:COSAG06_NODE_571_length_14101_cov_12.481682_10_plen_172_part_00